LTRLLVCVTSVILVGLFLLSNVPSSLALGSVSKVSPNQFLSPNLTKSPGFLAGYGDAFTGSSQTAANSSFIVPTVKCDVSASSAQYAFFFASITTSDGIYPSGVVTVCEEGSPTPAIFGYVGVSPYYITSFTPSAGDKILAMVVFTPSTSSFIFFIDDLTNGQRYQTSTTVTGISAEAGECVVDMAGLLANFGTVSFGQDHTRIGETCYLLINGTFAPVGSFGSAARLYKYVMVSGNTVLCKPSALSKDGSSFKVKWQNPG